MKVTKIKEGKRKEIPNQFRLDFPNPPKTGGDTGPIREFYKDGKFTASQFTGTMMYYFDYNEKAEMLYITVRDTKNMRSVLLHLINASPTRKEFAIMGETVQNYEFKVPLADIQKRTK